MTAVERAQIADEPRFEGFETIQTVGAAKLRWRDRVLGDVVTAVRPTLACQRAAKP